MFVCVCVFSLWSTESSANCKDIANSNCYDVTNSNVVVNVINIIVVVGFTNSNMLGETNSNMVEVLCIWAFTSASHLAAGYFLTGEPKREL